MNQKVPLNRGLAKSNPPRPGVIVPVAVQRTAQMPAGKPGVHNPSPFVPRTLAPVQRTPKAGPGIHYPPVFKPSMPAPPPVQRSPRGGPAAQSPHHPPLVAPAAPVQRLAKLPSARTGQPVAPAAKLASPVQTPARSGTIQQHPAPNRAQPLRRGVVQAVMAYRVEYPKSYKVQMNPSHVITGFGNDDGFGISISFGKPDHSEHFVQERKEDQLQGLRVVSWEFNNDWYAAIMAKAEKRGPNGLKGGQQSKYEKIAKLPGPSWSDGANLDTYTKKNALSFNDPRWFPILDKASKGQQATVEYPQPATKPVPPPIAVGLQDQVWAWCDGDNADTDGFPCTRAEAEMQQLRWRTV
jgi:hypothetical protein